METFQKLQLLDRINTISDYANIDNNAIAVLENAIIDYETNLIMNGVI
jgi:Fe-S cluster assembly iron-binding protein IscA